jgi:hypothetical protein
MSDEAIEIRAEDVTRDGHPVQVEVELRLGDAQGPATWPLNDASLERELRRVAVDVVASMRAQDFAREDDFETAFLDRYERAAELLLADAGHELHGLTVELDAGPPDPVVSMVQERRDTERRAAELSAMIVRVHTRYTVGEGST